MPKTLNIVSICISIAGYFLLAFFIERHEHSFLFTTYIAVFFAYLLLLKNIYALRLRHIILIGILFRLVFLVSLPSFSDDFYRFIWDGRLLAEGYNPYQYTPSYFVGENALPFLDADLYYKLNSQNYFSVYPPVVQFIFLLATSIFNGSIYGSVLLMKSISFIAELGLFYVLFRLIRRLRLRQHYMAVYILNPLVIIEIMGNIHHEGIMLLLLLLGIYLLLKNKFVHSAVIFALSVATKLIPLIFLPLLITRLDRKSLLIFSGVFAATILILFVPLIDGIFQGMGESISLYFQKFEFNASIYYIVREIGFWVKGYNIIQIAGPFLAITVFVLIIVYTLFSGKNVPWFKAMTWVMMIYLCFATTVHPWYIISLICFSVFTGYLFPVLWSLLIFFTYSGYSVEGYEEQTFLILFEYISVFILMFYELIKKDQILHRSIYVNPAV